MIAAIFVIENCTDAFKTSFINKKYGKLSIIEKLGEPFLITAWVVNWGGSKDWLLYYFNMRHVWHHTVASAKRNGFRKKECTTSFSSAPIFTRPKQFFDCGLNNVKLRNIFTILLTFFEYISMGFPKIMKGTLTVNHYSEFSCKSRFAEVDLAITSYLWKPNLNILILGSTDHVTWKLKVRVLIFILRERYVLQ